MLTSQQESKVVTAVGRYSLLHWAEKSVERKEQALHESIKGFSAEQMAEYSKRTAMFDKKMEESELKKDARKAGQ